MEVRSHLYLRPFYYIYKWKLEVICTEDHLIIYTNGINCTEDHLIIYTNGINCTEDHPIIYTNGS